MILFTFLPIIINNCISVKCARIFKVIDFNIGVPEEPNSNMTKFDVQYGASNNDPPLIHQVSLHQYGASNNDPPLIHQVSLHQSKLSNIKGIEMVLETFYP